MKKIIMVAPHLSTGGLPQYLVKQIELMRGEYEIWCVEWDSITGGVLVVQRNRILGMLGEGLVTLGEDKYEFLRLIDSIEPDIIHFQEIPETFVPTDILNAVWYEDRPYDIVVTTHSSYTDPSSIRYSADRYVLVSEWSRKRFASEFGDNRCTVWEYPIERKIYDKSTAKKRLGFDESKMHVLHVGLFTPGKNQSLLVEVARRLVSNNDVHFHFVGNQADNFREYWEPIMSDFPKNCTWHGERSDVDAFYMASDVFAFPSHFELNPLSIKEAIGYGLPLVMKKLHTYENDYDGMAIYINDDPNEVAGTLITKLLHGFKSNGNSLAAYSNLYQGISRVGQTRAVEPRIEINFINGPYVSISDAPGDVFDVKFINRKDGALMYAAEVSNGCWAKSNIRYAVDWLIRCVRRSDGKVFDYEFGPSEQNRVFIAFESKSIGDTLAWMPQVERFRQKWNCIVTCSTFWNDELVANYPEIEFVSPGSVVPNIYAMFVVGWFWNDEKHSGQMHPREFKTLPLGQTAADILGLDYEQAKTRLSVRPTEKMRRVGIGIHSTAQTKYWNNPTGWQELTNFFRTFGYEVMVMSNEGDGYMGNKHPDGVTVLPPGDFESLKAAISSCEIFVGIGSGLSWLAWTLGVRTVLISGFSVPVSEFEDEDVIRIFNETVCGGCYNRYKFNAGDWNWCPDHKGTERQFECTKSITGSKVISAIVERGWLSFA